MRGESLPFYGERKDCFGKWRALRLDLIYGSNRNFILNALPHIGKLMVPTLDEALAWCDWLVVTQIPDAQSAGRIAAAGKPIIDLAGWRASRRASA